MDRTGLTETDFYFNNHSFPPADAEYLYNIVRHTKPRKIVEIGSGFSTLITIKALEKNKLEDPAYTAAHTCIEPYEMPWLEKTGATIIRKKVEDTGNSFARSLEAGDILFIDSSHIIRPQGDVLFELLELLPLLNPGVLVHIHDIFTPKDYPDHWIFQQHRMWNEQYLLEAFLSMNQEYEVIGAVNYLAHHYGAALYAASPVFARRPEREPGSFWIRKK
jgi:predicted O-methyltransferase YrrM